MKIRLLGAAVLLALLVLFVPMFFPSSTPPGKGDQAVSLTIPPAPDRDLQTRTMDLSADTAAAAGSVAPATSSPVIPASTDKLATVDIPSQKAPEVTTGTAASPPVIPPTQAPAEVSKPAPPAASQPKPKAPAVVVQPVATPVSKPSSSPETDARGSYTLNLSAYASRSGADKLMKRVRTLGYPVQGHTITARGKTLTAVTAGPFTTRTAAESARLRISQSIPGVPVKLVSEASTPVGDAPASHVRASGWAVQVAAMSSQADANALRDKLRAGGFDGFVDSVSVGGKRLWRVRAGPQTQRDDALRVRDQIKAKLGLAGNVVSVP